MSAPRTAGRSADPPPASQLQRAEVRDVLAWLRLLADPRDAAAVVRSLTRPPIDLRQVDLARVIQIARRRKLNLVEGLGAANESPQVPAEARERIARFLTLHRELAAEAGSLPPEQLLGLIAERLGSRARGLAQPLAADGEVERLRSAARDYASSRPDATLTELADQLEGVGQPPSVAAAAPLEETMSALRDELLAEVASLGAQLNELRLDTDLDIAHGVVRYLELLKLSATLQRPEGETIEDALAGIDSRLQAAITPLQREILLSSHFNELLLGSPEVAIRAPRGREERSLSPFLPRRGEGLALSASDVETYRSCPLRYKYARVLRIPTAQTVSQRFGIVVHQVLERYHAEGGETLGELLALLDSCWRRSGLGDDESELLERGRAALRRYHARLATDRARPMWFERPFTFRLGPHQLRGRVDRVDRVAQGDGGECYELIDYKTSRPKTAEQLGQDVQLSLYALAAREAWQLESSRQAYYYVLDDVKTAVPAGAGAAEAVVDLVLAAGEGILGERFEPTPSPAACGLCDYRIICPAAEA